MEAGELAGDRARDLRRAATLAVSLLVITIAVHLVAIAFDLLERGVIADIQSGHVDLAAANASDTRQRAAGILQLVALVLTAVAFLFWFRQAYRNLPSLGVRKLRFKPGWAVGAWFVPFVNLVRPKAIANDIWRASDPEREPQGMRWIEWPVSPLLHWWWGLWLLAGFVQRVASRSSNRDDLSAQESADLADAAGLGLGIVAAVLAILVVRRVTDRQRAALAARAPTPGIASS